jgi:two-component system heavy metal sensor histidine kinase CusS
MTSLRTRLLAGTVGGMLLLLAVLSLIVYVTIRRALFEQFDTGLESTAHLFAASIEQDANDVELGIEPEFRDARHETYYQLWGADQTVIAESLSSDSADLWRIAEGADSPAFANSRTEDGRPLRAIGLRFTPRPADNDGEPPRKTTLKALSLTVARDATELHSQLRFLRWLLLTASAAVTALSLLLAAVVVRHGLAPLRSMAAQIGAIRADDLAARVDAEHTPAEITPIRDRLNDLLSRIEASFQRERRFTADVAHELRTPLAGIRSTIEVTLVRTRESREYQTVLSDCLEIVQNMQAMVSNLLMLARLDTRQIVFRRDRIPLADLVDACWRPFCERAEQRQITFESTIPDDLTCLCDPDNLSMVVSNLLANASEYTNDGGRIWIAAHPADGHMELAISNTGCSLSQEQISQVFDYFWRGDSSRRDAGVHCGLGLALVQRLVTALGGSVTAELQAGGVFAIRINIGGCPTDLR